MFVELYEMNLLQVPLNDEDVAVWRLQTAWLSGQMLGCLPGAGLCARFGPTRAAGVALLVAGLLQALSPLLWPSPYHAIVRALQGMAIVSLLTVPYGTV